MPVHSEISNDESNGATIFLFSNINEIIAFSNGVSNGVSNQESGRVVEIINSEIHEKVEEMLELLSTKLKREQLFEKMGLSNQTKNRSKYLDPLISIGWIEKEFLDEKTNPNQTYQTTDSGKKFSP